MNFEIYPPPQKDLIVFDGASLEKFEYVLENKNFFVIENRRERIKKIYCGVNFIFNFIVNFFKLILKERNFHTIYLYTLIKKIKPKIIITVVDNSFKFSDLAKLLGNEIKFIAVQNANRFDYAINRYRLQKKLIKKNLNKKYYFVPHYFCFGQNQIDRCKKHDIKVNKFYKIGSLNVANFFRFVEKNKINLNKEKYDICLISEPTLGLEKILNIKNIEERFANIAKHTIQYSKKNNLKFLFLQKRPFDTPNANSKLEVNFYKKYLNNQEFEFLLKNLNEKKNALSSYFGLFQSKIAVGAQSTLLSEKIGCKEKVLALGVENENLYDFPLNGICKLNDFDSNTLERRLDLIFKKNIAEYLQEINKPVNYVMEYDSNFSAIEKIRSYLI